MFRVIRRIFKRAWDLEIILPDGYSGTGKVLYRGRSLPVSEVHLDIVAGGLTKLTLCVHPMHMRVLLNNMNIDIKGLEGDTPNEIDHSSSVL